MGRPLLNNANLALRAELYRGLFSLIRREPTEEEIVRYALDTMGEALPDLRIGFSTVDTAGDLHVLYSRNVPGLPSLAGLHTNLAGASLFCEAMLRLQTVVIDDPATSALGQQLGKAEPRLAAEGSRLFCPFDEAEGRITLFTITKPAVEPWDPNLVATIREAGELVHLLRRDARARSQIVAKAKLAAIGEMASGIAHEINNPLAVIDGLLRQLREQEEKKRRPDPATVQNFETISRMVGRISAITRGLRTFSRQTDLDPLQPASLKEIAEEAAALIHPRIAGEEISFTLQLADTPLRCRARASEVLQVLLNLLNNAIDATEGRSERIITLRLRAGHRHVAAEVSDNGPGISEDLRGRIFLPFFTTKEVGRGTGLGLSISKRIVEAHGGSLRLETVPGLTTFVMEIPKETL